MAKVRNLRERPRTSQRNSQWILRSTHRHKALAGKAIKQGFYWPTINIDAKTLVRQCEACHKMVNQQNLPSMPVHLIPPSWLLQRWGMDLVGPLPTAQGNYRFATVALNYFTKWVEAKPLVNIKAPTIQKFF
jgi:hypothetical protein